MTGQGATGRLIRAELRLVLREPFVLTFVLAFPVVTMLIIGGSFGTSPTSAFDHTDPSHWYVASYLTVVIGATGLLMIPVHLASYREQGVLRRFAAAGFPSWSFALAQLVVGALSVLVSSAVLLAVALPVYGVPHLQHPARVVTAFCLGTLAFLSIGVFIGSLMPSARSAQAVGLLLFFPSFLLGSGGPPPGTMGAALRSIAQVLPLSLVTDAVRKPWLGISTAGSTLAWVALLAVVASAMAASRARL